MVHSQLCKCVLYSLLMPYKRRTESLLADKGNNIGHNVLIGHLIPCGVQLLLREVMAVKLQL